MTHNFSQRDGLPMLFTVDIQNKEITFASDGMVMEGDTVSGGVAGTIKEVVEERPSKGRWKQCGFEEPPTFYRVKLY